MHTCVRFTLIVLVMAAVLFVLLTGCGASAPATQAVRNTAEGAEVEITREIVREAAMTPTPAATLSEIRSREYTPVSLPDRPNRLIVKDAELELLVTDTDAAIDRTTQIAADCAGYIISSRVWYEEWLGEKYKYATITLGVPADQFERAMRRLRQLALQVVDETASGQDVTDEYIDLQSRLDNLKATRDRIREFLDQAKTVEESLRVNEELAAIEEQIEQVQGRMNYLFDRAAYSTITVQIEPELPQPTPTPVPTLTPTPIPAPPWSPVQSARQAGQTLGSILRVLTEIAIWFGIVILPLAAPPILVIWGIRHWTGRNKA